ncbi:MAG TPA: hypothetical protein VJJ21_02545 [Candidatus Nanoarchaeia archaeon]|nr:hypothetical protein [Candidatus Nanoarchaeia archaeon]
MAQQSLLHPQEIEVFYIIPTLRRNLAISMKKQGLNQKQIAVLLNIEDAAVSQYINEKRGNKVQLSEEIIKEVNKSASLVKDKLSFLREMQRLLKTVQDSREICKIHKQFSNLPDNCTPEAVLCCRR